MIGHPAFTVEPWCLRATDLELAVLAQAESVFALANGHIGWRRNLDEGEPDGLPGSYLNGVYEVRPLPYAEAGYGYPESGQTVINVTNGKLIRLLVDDEPFGTDPVPPKSLLATIVLGLAVLQVLLALWMYRKLPLAGRPPRPVPVTHRVTGFALVALTVPVAVHCLIAYGVQLTSLRVAVHSVAGCFFYGAFTAKVLLVRSKRLPGWALPAAGGMLAIIAGILWYSSALWYYHGYQLPHL